MENLSMMAAMAVRDAIEVAIQNFERELKVTTPVPEQHKDYFQKQDKKKLRAIEQMRGLSAAVNLRVFTAYREEYINRDDRT